MNKWWDDFRTLLFKRALLLSGDPEEWVEEVTFRYLRTVRWVTIVGIPAVGLSLFLGWVYVTLATLAVVMVVYAPIFWVLRTSYDSLPGRLQESLSAWLRRGGAFLFGALLVVVFVDAFGLGGSREALLIFAALGAGVAMGWWKISDRVRNAVGLHLLVGLYGIAIVARFPLVSEVFAWVGERARVAVMGVTRPTPERYLPSSAEELREAFVDKGTGEFLMWYWRDDQGGYEFYRSRGYDRFGSPLKRAETQPEFDALIAWQREEDAEAQARREQQQREALADYQEWRETAKSRLAAGELDEAERAVGRAEASIEEHKSLLDEAGVLDATAELRDIREAIGAAEDALLEERRAVAFAEYARERDSAKERLAAGDFDEAEHALDRAGALIAGQENLLDEGRVLVATAEMRHIREAIAAARAEQLRIAKEAEAAAMAMEAERKRRGSYVVARPDGRVKYIVFAVDPVEAPMNEVALATAARLSAAGIAASGHVFSDAFASAQGFDAFFTGRGGSDIVAMDLGGVADRLLLIRAGQPEVGTASASAAVRTYSAVMHASIIDARDGKKLAEFATRDVTGAGVNDSAAVSAFIERYAEAVVGRDEVLTGMR